jgi:hypothetical protein
MGPHIRCRSRSGLLQRHREDIAQRQLEPRLPTAQQRADPELVAAKWSIYFSVSHSPAAIGVSRPLPSIWRRGGRVVGWEFLKFNGDFAKRRLLPSNPGPFGRFRSLPVGLAAVPICKIRTFKIRDQPDNTCAGILIHC